MNNPGYIRDISGRYTIGPQSDEIGPLVVDTHVGRVVGVYIDDSTPNIADWISRAVAKYPDGIVFVTVPPGAPRLRHRPAPPVVNLQEWYPYHSGFPVAEWGLMPPCGEGEGYCLQNRFWGFSGKWPISWGRRRKLIREARAHNPRYIFLF